MFWPGYTEFLDLTNPFSTIVPVGHPQPKTDSSPATLTILIVRMLPLNTALLNTLNSLGQHPDLQFADSN